VYATSYRTTAKSLERATADRIMNAMLGDDRRFRWGGRITSSATTHGGDGRFWRLHASLVDAIFSPMF
jgi:hypothetical protein